MTVVRYEREFVRGIDFGRNCEKVSRSNEAIKRCKISKDESVPLRELSGNVEFQNRNHSTRFVISRSRKFKEPQLRRV